MKGGTKKKIGCLGFSANPPHLGHSEVARLFLRKKLVDEIWLIPCFAHPFNKELASVEHRWRMAKLLEGKRIKVSDIEIARGGKSYTIDTVRELYVKYQDCEFSWIIGSDIVKTKSCKKWKDWGKLRELIDFLVIVRPGYEIKKLPTGFIFAGRATKNISSTEIREKVRCGLPIDGLAPPAVKEYIEKHNLYG